ncbi:MAG TPA: NADPH:quinone reductase [Gemmatimonadetes bacterium]|nr:NADPH:quinone reductase [Gemmatimonadota bacterium]|tara:strand:+ start:15953 stop:16879 length:927 start_codon:yes stop_codon:yes gene_type:complete
MVMEDMPTQDPGPGQARLRVAFAGVNFIDIYHRTGAYPMALPFTPGSEGAGVVEAMGDSSTGLKEGDRVAWAMHPNGYAERSVVDVWKLVPVPPAVELDVAAAVMLQGMTAHYLTHSTFPLREGHVALVHAAAGGVGLLLTQMAKMRGAKVIGTVSTEEKAALARTAGADEVVIYTRESFQEAAHGITGGQGVDVVYDSVGMSTFEESLDSLRPRGYLVLFGQSSGPVPPLEPGVLSRKGSLFLTRPGLAHHVASREELLWRARDVFSWITDRSLSPRIDNVLPLERSAEAHRLLEGRATAGKILLKC